MGSDEKSLSPPLSGTISLSLIVTTLIDFQFNSIVFSRFHNMDDQRTAFLGQFFTLLLIFSYVLHIILTKRILKKFAIRIALLITPVILFWGSLAAFVVPGVFLIHWGILLKGADKSFSYSLNQSVRELLYIPLEPDMRRAKVILDMFINRLSRAAGALILFVALGVLHFSLLGISALTVVFAGLWIGFNFLIIREYVDLLKINLQMKWEDADLWIHEQVDIDMTKLVFDTLQSRNRSSVFYAMNLFDLLKKNG